jgi:hypothetical protein
VGFIVVLLTLAPSAAAVAPPNPAFVPQSLRDAAIASPDQVFRVIVQGGPSTTVAGVEAGVQQTLTNVPAPAGGISNAFSSIDAVAAELTGQQILDLEQSPGIFAITPDAPLRASVVDPPFALEPPTITGTAETGESLSASPGQWSGAQPLDYAFAWQRCDAASVCADITGANASSYVVSADDVGSTLVASVTATNGDGSATATSAATAVVSSPPPPPIVMPPVAFVSPTLAGSAAVGETLTTTDGVWSADTVGVARQWQRCSPVGDACLNIDGASGSTYLLGGDDLGLTLRVVVTATNAFGSAAAATSATDVIAAAPGPPPPGEIGAGSSLASVLSAPTVTGTAKAGETLTADDGTWSGDAIALARQWQRCSPTGESCLDIDAATGLTFLLGPDDIGSTLRVVVTATDPVGSTAAASSVTGVVTPAATPDPPPPPSALTTPTVTGTATAGETLSAADGTWSGDAITLARQWQRCSPAGEACLDIDGATGQTFVLSNDDVGSTVRVVVTATDAFGNAAAASNVTGVVAPATPDPSPSMLTAPAVTGTATVGETLTAADGTWSGDAIDFTRQWRRCSPAGDACVDIDGATGQTYLLGDGDVGSTISIVVTATDAFGVGLASSDASAVVAPASAATPDPLPPSMLSAPTVTGSATAWATLTANDGTWSGDAVVLARQWQRCSPTGGDCSDITGASSRTYLLRTADVGFTVRVALTATDAVGSTTATSAVTDVVAAAADSRTPPPPVNVKPPSFDRNAVAGSSLVANKGNWSSSGGSQEYTFRWERCGAAGGSCASVGTRRSYTPVDADIGSRLRLTVSATVEDHGRTSAPASATSALGDRVAPFSLSGFWSWQLGAYAAGVDKQWTAVSTADAAPPAIAVVDSGVDPTLPGLQGAVVQQVKMTSLPQGTAADGYGHGSFVAQVAAGRGPGEAGAAPKAPIVSLDVMNDDGMALTSDVVAAADWIYTHKDESNIRVANFSLIGSSPSSIMFDPLDRALEHLWLSGVVVVTAAGNYGANGQPSDVAFSPANDPFAITVGASDLAGTISTSDDFAAPWSVYGHTLDGFAKPELGAPGRYVVANVPTSSTLYSQRPGSIVEPGRLQLSGTSFAAPFVAGVAANLLALHPDWTPDQVKGALMVTATVPGAAATFSLGVGEIDAAAALGVTDPPNPNEAIEQFLVADPSGGATPVFDTASWGTTAQANASWGTASWGTASWGTASWGTASWGTAYWSSASWGTASWGTASWGTASWGTQAKPEDNTTDDVLPAGGYWMNWPGV